MNLSNIPVAPHAIGFIKVACDDDPMLGEPRTRNEFLITQRHHEPGAPSPDGLRPPRLAAHAMHAKLATKGEDGASSVKEIPIRLYFNKAQNAISIRYQAYRAQGNVPVCSGDGKTARRLVDAGDSTPTLQDIPCPGPDRCQFVQGGEARCARQVRMAVQIDDQDDPLGVFEIRTSSLNTYRALKSQLLMIEKRFGGLRHVPLKLALWQASNEASSYEAFSLMRLQLNAETEAKALEQARAVRRELAEAGIDDDVDGITSDGDAEDFAAVGAPLDFQAVQEFYMQPPGGRRAGTVPVTPSTVAATRAGATALAGVANAAFAGAVSAAMERSAQASGRAGEQPMLAPGEGQDCRQQAAAVS